MAIEVGTKDVAGALGVSEVSCHKLRKGDGGPRFEKFGGRYKYPLGKFLRWLLDRERQRADAKLDRIYKRVSLIETQLQKERESAQVKFRRKIVNVLSAAHGITMPEFYAFLADQGYLRIKDIPPEDYDEMLAALMEPVKVRAPTAEACFTISN